jgi:hypothetical protein
MGLFDSLLSPFGIRLTHNSPYPDSGMGDKAIGEYKKASPFYDFLTSEGKNLASTAAPLAQQYATGNVSAADTPQSMQNFATYAGIAPNGTAASDPYGLGAYQTAQYNQQRDAITGQLKNSMGRLEASLSARGLKPGDPSYDAAMQHLSDAHNQALNEHQTGFMENARQQHQQAAQTFAGMLNQYGQQRFANENSLLGEGANMIGQGTQGYEQGAALNNSIGQQAQQHNAQTNAFWQGLVGAGVGAATGVPGYHGPSGGGNPFAPGGSGGEVPGFGYTQNNQTLGDNPTASYSPITLSGGFGSGFGGGGTPSTGFNPTLGYGLNANTGNPMGGASVANNNSLFKTPKQGGA